MKKLIPEYTYSATKEKKYLKYILLKFNNVVDYNKACKILNVTNIKDGLFSEYRAVDGNTAINLIKRS